MSSKVSNQTAGGRRTPLAMGPASSQKLNAKTNNETIDLTMPDVKHRKSDDQKKNEKLESPAKNSSAKDATNNGTETNAKKEKTSKKDSINNSHENGHNDNKEEGKSTATSQEEKISKKGDKKNLARESPRNKDLIVAKETNKETEKTAKSAANATRSKSPDKEKDKRTTPIEKDHKNQKKSNEEAQKGKANKSVEDVKKNEAKGKKDQHADQKKTAEEEIVAPKRSSRVTALTQQASKQEQNVTGGSLGQQSLFRGFDEAMENDVEMESLLLDVEVSESATTIPTASRSSSIRKSFNEEKDLPETPVRSPRKESVLPPKPLPAIEVPVTSTPDGKVFYTLPPSSLRSISGRRSLRPLKEYSFQYASNYRESYRPINTELDCTNNTSMNVTVGSEIAPQNESSFISSFFSFGRGKKRPLTPPPTVSTTDDIQDDAVNTNTASPKRARLDLSGLIGLVASPVTMLKNRLIRTRIDSSTPNNKTEEINEIEVDNAEEGTENELEIVSEDKQKMLSDEEENEIINDETIDNNDETIDFNKDELSCDDSIEKEKSVEHLSKIEVADEAVAGSNDIVDEQSAVNRRRCIVM